MEQRGRPVSPRSVYRYLRWTIARETTPPAEEIIHQFACTTCGTEGVPDVEFEAARGWIFAHLAGNPSHTGYVEQIHRYWRAHLEGPARPSDPVPVSIPAPTPAGTEHDRQSAGVQ
jgi:hypothetical protein